MAEQNREKLISLDNVCKYFNVGRGKTLKAVDGITLDIYRGETLGVVGESGCGKSTLGRVVMGIYHPTSGKLEYEGQEVNLRKTKDRFQYSKKAQIIFQDPYASLNPRMTVAISLPRVWKSMACTRKSSAPGACTSCWRRWA